jgi:hypothetical protein
MTAVIDTPSTNGKAPKAAAKPAPTAETPQVEISRIGRETLLVPIRGTSPLIMSKFSEKARRQMLDAQQGRRTPKQNRDPEAEYQAALYRMDGDRYGFPAVGFKAAMISASRFYGKAVTMTALRQFVFMKGELTSADPQMLVEIVGTPRMREDVVRLAGPSRSADLRFRPEFPEWSTTLTVLFVKNCISRESVLSLIDASGMGVGVGEWRPERDGEFGTFEIDPDREVTVLG